MGAQILEVALALRAHVTLPHIHHGLPNQQRRRDACQHLESLRDEGEVQLFVDLVEIVGGRLGEHAERAAGVAHVGEGG